MHNAAVDDLQILAVGNNQQTVPEAFLHCLPQQLIGFHRSAVVGNRPDPCIHQCCVIAKRLSLHALGNAAHRMHLYSGIRRLFQNITDSFRSINGGLCVGHASHTGDTTCQSRCCSRVDILLIGQPRIPEMHMHIEQSRQSCQTFCVQHLIRSFVYTADLQDLPLRQQHIALPALQAHIPNQNSIHSALLRIQKDTIGIVKLRHFHPNGFLS